MKINVTSKELDYLDLKWGKEIREELNFYNLLKWMKISNKKNYFQQTSNFNILNLRCKTKVIRRLWGGKRKERRNEGTKIYPNI